ncbi:Acid phosphatase protein [Dioscorea alata]|uniref:Acid phosphatase protein n=1 Tax=Dioscorea alata TaxID=55571 RepID=A0ACB7V8Q0_DIOAL|nr:Acid phosphatase protein [Dioscorea alata]
MNVEVHNILGFRHIPKECINYISKYMTTQYKADVRRATEEAMVFLNKNIQHSSDNLDAWIFDVDDTLLSTVPYYENNNACGEEMPVLLETWMKEAKAPAVEYMVELFHKIKGRGFKILLISSRKEHLTGVTIDNLMKAGYYGWDQLKLRCPADDNYSIKEYKAKQRKKFKEEGYRLCGNIGDQWSSLNGDHYAIRSFKLPNPMYYEA